MQWTPKNKPKFKEKIQLQGFKMAQFDKNARKKTKFAHVRKKKKIRKSKKKWEGRTQNQRKNIKTQGGKE